MLVHIGKPSEFYLLFFTFNCPSVPSHLQDKFIIRVLIMYDVESFQRFLNLLRPLLYTLCCYPGNSHIDTFLLNETSK